MTADAYRVLGLRRDATPAEIKKAHREAIVDCHPDRHPGDKIKAARFLAVQKAYELLSDPDKRVAYDRLSAGVTPEVLAYVASDFWDCVVMAGTGNLRGGIAEFFQRVRTSPHWEAVQTAMAAPPSAMATPRPSAQGNRRTRADLQAELDALRQENERLKRETAG